MWTEFNTQASADNSWRARLLVLLAATVWLLVVLWGPHVVQHPGYHDFADQRSWGALPHAVDVLSNLGFLLTAVLGALGLWRMRDAAVSLHARWMAAWFFVGMACSAAGSAFYHWTPDDAALAWDRVGMSVVFAGMVGLAVQQTCDDAAAWLAASCMLLAALVSVALWSRTGNMLPWAVVQGGGMLAIVVMAFLPARMDSLRVSLGAAIAFYAVAKLFEWGDARVFELDHGLISGHSLKHLLAACAALPVLSALARCAKTTSQK